MDDAFSATYTLYRDAIYRYCLYKSHDREIGEDLMQETFLRYLACVRDEKEITHVRAFLYRIAHNLFISYVRRKRESSLDQLLEGGFEPSVDPWQKIKSRLDAERVLIDIRSKDRPSTLTLYRRFILGLTPAEIASMTGTTPNAVSIALHRSLKHLRHDLDTAPRRLHAARPRHRRQDEARSAVVRPISLPFSLPPLSHGR